MADDSSVANRRSARTRRKNPLYEDYFVGTGGNLYSIPKSLHSLHPVLKRSSLKEAATGNAPSGLLSHPDAVESFEEDVGERTTATNRTEDAVPDTVSAAWPSESRKKSRLKQIVDALSHSNAAAAPDGIGTITAKSTSRRRDYRHANRRNRPHRRKPVSLDRKEPGSGGKPQSHEANVDQNFLPTTDVDMSAAEASLLQQPTSTAVDLSPDAVRTNISETKADDQHHDSVKTLPVDLSSNNAELIKTLCRSPIKLLQLAAPSEVRKNSDPDFDVIRQSMAGKTASVPNIRTYVATDSKVADTTTSSGTADVESPMEICSQLTTSMRPPTPKALVVDSHASIKSSQSTPALAAVREQIPGTGAVEPVNFTSTRHRETAGDRLSSMQPLLLDAASIKQAVRNRYTTAAMREAESHTYATPSGRPRITRALPLEIESSANISRWSVDNVLEFGQHVYGLSHDELELIKCERLDGSALLLLDKQIAYMLAKVKSYRVASVLRVWQFGQHLALKFVDTRQQMNLIASLWKTMPPPVNMFTVTTADSVES